MRKTIAVLAVIAAIALSAPSAFAYTCNSRQQVFIGPGGPYYDYVGNPLDTSSSQCWTLDMSGPYWNSTAGEWEYRYWNDQTATQTVTASGTSTSYSAQLYIDFDDANASWWNAIDAEVDVNHNGTHTTYIIFSIVGNGGVTSVHATKSVNFTAQPGDSITVSIKGRNSYYGSGTTVRFSSVHIYQYGS